MRRSILLATALVLAAGCGPQPAAVTSPAASATTSPTPLDTQLPTPSPSPSRTPLVVLTPALPPICAGRPAPAGPGIGPGRPGIGGARTGAGARFPPEPDYGPGPAPRPSALAPDNGP